MISDFYKDFKQNKLTSEGIINTILSDLGGGLYPYLLMLIAAERKQEAVLIENLRKLIFEARDNFDKKLLSEEQVALELKRVYKYLSIQLTLIATIPEKQWENSLFTSYLNELVNFAYWLKPNIDINHI